MSSAGLPLFLQFKEAQGQDTPAGLETSAEPDQADSDLAVAESDSESVQESATIEADVAEPETDAGARGAGAPADRTEGGIAEAAPTDEAPSEDGGKDQEITEPESEDAQSAATPREGEASDESLGESVGEGGVASVQMKCACGGSCEHCQKRDYEGQGEQAESSAVQASGGSPTGTSPEELRTALPTGTSLPGPTVARFSQAFGRDFKSVRLHESNATVRSMGARALTVGRHVAFAPGEYRPGTPDGDRLMAHELAHVAQQSGGGPRPQAAGLSYNAYEAEADRAAETAVRGGRVETITPVGRKVQRSNFVTEFLEDRVWGFVRRRFPSIESYLRQPSRLWTSLVEAMGRGIGQVVNQVLAPVRNLHPIDRLRELFGPLLAGAAVAFQSGGRNCEPFLAAVRQLSSALGRLTAGPLHTIRQAFNRVRSLFQSVLRRVAQPVGQLLRSVGGAAYRAVRAVADRIGLLAGTLREWGGRAWDWLQSKLGLGGGGSGSGEGVFDFIKRKVREAWEVARPRLLPFLGPLRTAAGILLAISPVGPIFLAIRYGPRLVSWLTEIYRHLGVPERIVAARAFIARRLPVLAGSLISAAARLAGIPSLMRGFSRVAAGVRSVAGSLSGLPLVAAAGGALEFVAGKIDQGVNWVSTAVRGAASRIQNGLRTAGVWLGKVAAGAGKLIGLVTNPLGIAGFLAGEIWLQIPRCFKAPIINWILGLIMRVIRSIPANPVLGVMFEMFRHAMLGFLGHVRALSDQRKEEISDRIARLAKGSVSFMLGLAWGVVKGVGEGLLMPFILLYDLITAIPKVVEFVSRLPAQIVSALSGIAVSVAEAAQAAVAGFWPAMRSALTSTSGSLMRWLREAWDALTGAAGSAGGAVAGALISFIMLSDFELGEKLGWVAGTVLFEVVLAYLTGGASALVKSASVPLRMLGRVLRVVTKAHEIMNHVFGLVFRAIEPAINGIRKLVQKVLPSLESKLAAILERFGKLLRSAEEAGEAMGSRLAGREAGVVRGVEGTAARASERIGGRAESQAGEGTVRAGIHEQPPVRSEPVAEPIPPAGRERQVVGQEAPRPLERPAEPHAARERSAAESGHLESARLSEQQISNEMQHMVDNPRVMDGLPPNRRARIGEHEWIEQPNGVWCRHSLIPGVCVKVPEKSGLRAPVGTPALNATQERRLRTAMNKLANQEIEGYRALQGAENLGEFFARYSSTENALAALEREVDALLRARALQISERRRTSSTNQSSRHDELNFPNAETGPEQRWSREQVLGGTPGKRSSTGREVIERMRSKGRLRGVEPNEEVFRPSTQEWVPISECDMGHTTDAVTWWNNYGHFHGPNSPEARRFMTNSENYELQHFSDNRSAGASLGRNEQYRAPHPDPITEEMLQTIKAHNAGGD